MIILILIKHFNIIKDYIKKIKINEINNWNSKDKNGQLSLEFILISFVALLIFISITLPLTNIAVDSTLDATNSLETKSEILKITNAIDDVYSDGIGSKRTVYVEVPHDTSINFFNDIASNSGIASGNIILNNNTNKLIEVSYNANNCESNLNLKKRINTKIIIDWSSSSDKIIVRN